MRLIRTQIVCSAAAAALAAAGAARAQCGSSLIVAGDRSANAHFGSSMTVGPTGIGERLFVGAPRSIIQSQAGGVYSYHSSAGGWVQDDEIRPGIGGWISDSFGTSIALSDPYMIVGDTGGGPAGDGGAYFFERSGSTWVQKSELTGTQVDSFLGASVAISGETAAAGAPYFAYTDNPANPNTNCGMVQYYVRQADGTWAQSGYVLHHDAAGSHAFDQLGYSVAMSGPVVVMGAPGARPGAAGAGASGGIEVYRRNALNQWLSDTPNPFSRLWAPDAADGDSFGLSVAVDGNFIVVGAPNRDASAAEGGPMTDSGAAYVFRYTNNAWTFDGKLLASDAAANDLFGAAVSIAGGGGLIAGRVVVSAPAAHKAYIFHRGIYGGWTQDAVFHDPAISPQSFGSAVATDGTNFFVGDTLWDNPAPGITNCGAAYAFAMPSTAQGAASDTCEGASALNLLSGQQNLITGCTDSASPSKPAILGCGGANAGNDIWYAWVPSCSGNVVMDTYGSAFDTILSIHTACPAAGDEHIIACNDDGFPYPNRASLVTFNYTAGQLYYIRVTGYGGDHGNYTLRINDFAPVPQNDSCASPQVVTAPGNYPYRACAATTEPNMPLACGTAMVKDLWFVFTPNVTGTLKADTCSSNYDTVLAVYGGAACPGANTQPVACNDDSTLITPCGALGSAVSTSILGGFPYLIRVGSYPYNGNSAGEGSLHITFTPNCRADFNQSGTVTVQDLFDFLQAWFANNPTADFNSSGTVSVQDIFDFLQAWFTGCP